ncbi:CPBP family intramembrane glutamic endopeptidase [Natronospora cellulosivora (SeqCode)]
MEKRENYTTIFILAFFALALNTNLITYLSNFINFPTGNTLTNLMEYRTPIEVFIISNIWAPVIEEILFRGIILKGLLKEYKVVYAIVFSSILFALVHFYPHQIIISFFAGLILGFIYYKTASLLSVILLHALYNTYIDLLVFLENRFSLEILTILPNKFYIFISLIIILSLLYDLSKNNNYNWQSEEIKYLL